MRRLEDKTALVTGGAGGIGAATARLFAEEGCRIALVDWEKDLIEDVATRIEAEVAGSEILTIAGDVGKEETAGKAVATTIAAFGAIDILTNIAGIRSYEPLAESKAETWDKIIRINLLSYAYFAREALPALRGSGRGAIVNVSSTHAFNPRAGMGQYDVTKAGIISMTRTLAFEEAEHGVRVNAVCPGLTLTPFHERRLGKPGKELLAEKVDVNLLRRWADPREIAYPILWLASDEASFVTAETIMVDGGSRV